MHWPYVSMMGYSSYPIFALPQFAIQANFPTTMAIMPFPQQAQNNEFLYKNDIQPQKQLIKTESQYIDLTAQDLLKAGYQATKSLWTEEEDRKLKNLCKTKSKDWKKIASLIPGRNQNMCYSRFRRLKLSCRENWKKIENEKILRLVRKHGMDWNIISTHFQNRSAKIIKQHYINHLAPDINKSEWTLEEDLKLIDLLNLHGKKWQQISTYMNGRTIINIKNRFYGRLKRLVDAKSQGQQVHLSQEGEYLENDQMQIKQKRGSKSRQRAVCKSPFIRVTLIKQDSLKLKRNKIHILFNFEYSISISIKNLDFIVENLEI